MNIKLNQIFQEILFIKKEYVEKIKIIKSEKEKEKILKNGNVEYIKQCIEDREKFKLEDYDVIELILSINDPEYTKKFINDFQTYNFSNYLINDLILSIGDPEYTKQCIKNGKKLHIDSTSLSDLIQEIADKDYIKKSIINAKELGLDSFDIVMLITDINEYEFTKQCLFNKDAIGIDNYDISNVFSTMTADQVEEILRSEEISLDSFTIMDVIRDRKEAELFNKILENPSRYGISREDMIYLHFPEETLKGIIKDPLKYNISFADLSIYIEEGMQEYTKELIYSDEIDSSLKATLLMAIMDDDFIIHCIENNEKIGLKSYEIVDIVEMKNLNADVVKKFVDDKEKIGLDNKAIIQLINDTQDEKYIKKCIQNKDKFGFSDIEVLDLFRDDNDKIEYLKEKNSKELMQEYRKKADIDFIYNNREVFFQIEGINDFQKQVLLDMYEKNNDVIRVDFRLCDERIVNVLGKDKVNQLACYPAVADVIINMNDIELTVFQKCIDNYMQNDKNGEWTVFANNFLKNIDSCKELINSIDNISEINIDNLTNIILSGNRFDIRKDQVNDYPIIKARKCDELIKSDDLKDKKTALLYKAFDFGIHTAKVILEKYGNEIDMIEDTYLKNYLESIEGVLNSTSSDVIENIYNKINTVNLRNRLEIERRLKNDFAKKYNDGLFVVEDAIEQDMEKFEEIVENSIKYYMGDDERQVILDKMKNCKIVNASMDFKMIVTSIAPFVYNSPQNFKKDWNRPAIGSQHFCTNYIRNDMIGIAPIPHVMYGFSNMSQDSLVLSGPTDVWSSGIALESTASHDEIYYTPDQQINRTICRGDSTYNEMDWKRIQNGAKKQPDYIVVFKKDNIIKNIPDIIKCVEDWNYELPIVVVDVDEILINEKGKVNELIEAYKKEPTKELAKKIYNSINNNRKTTSRFSIKEFCGNENIEEYKQQFENKVTERDLQSIDANVSDAERKSEYSKLRSLFVKLEMVDVEK